MEPQCESHGHGSERRPPADPEALLTSILESTLNGILAIDEEGRVLYANRRFSELWNIPKHVAEKKDNRILLNYVSDQLKEPGAFFSRVAELRHSPEDSLVLIPLKGGRVLECFSSPLILNGKMKGRVWRFWDVTERERANEGLRMAQFSLNVASIGILWITRDGDFWYANDAVCRSLGYPRDELLRMNIADIDPDYPTDRRQSHWERLKREKSLTFETVHRTKEGRVFPVEITSHHIKLDSKEYEFAFARDISEYKEAERAVQKQTAIIGGINTVFRESLACDTEEEVALACLKVAEKLTGSKVGFIGEVNSEGCFGTIAMSALGSDLCRLPDTERHQQICGIDVRGIWGWVLKHGESLIVNDLDLCPHRGGLPEGHPPIWSFLGVPLHRGSETIGMIALANKENGYEEDDRECIEALSVALVEALDRKHREEAIARSEQHYRGLIESVPDVVWRTDMEGRLTFVSSVAKAMFGFEPGELLGKPFDTFLSDESKQKAREAFESRKKGELGAAGVVLELVHRRKDGTEFVTSTTTSPVFDTNGRPIEIVGITRDVTENRRLEDQLRQSQKMEAVGRLTAGIAHDFNNLLTAINGYSALVLDQIPEGSPLRQDILEIERAGDRAASLTRQLLAFSRKQIFQPKQVVLNQLILEMDKMLRRMIGEDIELVTITSPGLGLSELDPSQVEQIVMNLVVNARDAMPTGGKLTIETKNVELGEDYTRDHVDAHPGPYVMLAVSDTGCGMDEETKELVFEPFYTSKEPGKGTGLGLATVYGIVKQSGGIVYLYSEPGEGTTFKIYFPRLSEEDKRLQTEKPATKMLQGSETILLVEDNDVVRKIIFRSLKKYGYTVLEAGYGSQAIEVYQRHEGQVHLLISDIVMPKMSGRELAERLLSKNPAMKVLFMSGYTDEAIVRHGVLDKEVEFLQKPFTPDVLGRKVREILDAA